MNIRMKIVNFLGTFESEIMKVTEKQYSEIVEISKSFWITDTSFSMWKDNGFIIFPPEIASKSILIIEIIK